MLNLLLSLPQIKQGFSTRIMKAKELLFPAEKQEEFASWDNIEEPLLGMYGLAELLWNQFNSCTIIYFSKKKNSIFYIILNTQAEVP